MNNGSDIKMTALPNQLDIPNSLLLLRDKSLSILITIIISEIVLLVNAVTFVIVHKLKPHVLFKTSKKRKIAESC